MNKTVIDKVIKYFKNKTEVAAVYLYGSQIKGTAKKSSDIDLGVLMASYDSYQGFGIPQVAFAQDLSTITGHKVEVQDLKVCRVDFAHRVLIEGRLLLDNDEKMRSQFEENIFRRYFDMKPFFDEYYKSLSEMAKKGELGARYI